MGRHRWIIGSCVPLLPGVGAALAAAGAGAAGHWFTPVFVFGLVPALDRLWGDAAADPAGAVLEAAALDPWYHRVLVAFVPVYLATMATGLWALAQGATHGAAGALGLAVSLGITSGVATNAAHELGHRTRTRDRWLARVALAPTLYGHFPVEHNRGHHLRVATPEDPASARYGESFWAFLPRTVLRGVASAVRLERERLARRGRPFLHPGNELLQGWALNALFLLAVLLAGGPVLLAWAVGQAGVGIQLLEGVNYVEHYGLCRARRPDGRPVRVAPEHSWNSNHLVTNVLLFQLQRHSDHHEYARRPYQSLRHRPSAPQLPTGYAGMLLLAFVPPLWHRVMDPRVREHYGGDLSLANHG